MFPSKSYTQEEFNKEMAELLPKARPHDPKATLDHINNLFAMSLNRDQAPQKAFLLNLAEKTENPETDEEACVQILTLVKVKAAAFLMLTEKRIASLRITQKAAPWIIYSGTKEDDTVAEIIVRQYPDYMRYVTRAYIRGLPDSPNPVATRSQTVETQT